MLRNGAREKALSRKVMLSLLMAGTMSVCISGGDVWAAADKLTGDVTYNAISEVPASVEMNGYNITSNVILNADNAGLSIIGTDMENLTINGEGLQFAVAAQSSSNAKVLISNVKKVDITGNVTSDSLLHSNINGAIIFDKVGLFNITTEKSIGLHAQGGLISIDADAVSIKSKDENAIWAQLSNCSGDYPSDVKIKSSGDITLQSTSSTAVGAANMDSNVTDNKVTVDLQGKNINVISEKSTGLLSNDFQTGKTGIILNADDVVKIQAGKNGIYAANGRNKGDAFVSIDAGKEINITGVKNAVYAGSNALVKINDKGTAKVSLTGNVVAENGGQIVVKNADQMGALKVDGGIYNGNNISIKYSAPTLDDRTAVYVANNGSAVFDGDKTEIIINSQSENDPRGVWVTSGGKVEFNAKETVIDVTGVGGSSKWGFGLLLNGTVGGSAVFNGQNVAIKNYQDHYTSQTVTAKAGSEITFNNTGNVLISAKSPFGVTAVDNQGNITFNNSGNVDIVGTIVPDDKSAQTNVVGIQSGSSGAETVVTDKVKDFNITLSGAGVDNDGTGYSTGTYGIILDKDVKALINSATLNIKMNVADNVEDISPGDHTTEEAYGIDPDGGYITVGTGTVTNITVQEGLGTAYAVNAASDASVVELLGDTTIVAAGKTASYALNAEDGGQITIGSTGKIVNLTGDIVAKNDGVINIAGKTNTINGIVKAVDGGTVNLSGASDAVYNNININSFVTQGTGSNGSVKLNGGTMDFGRLNNQNLASNSFVVNGGSLKAASKDIFTNSLTAAGTAIDSGNVLFVVNNAVKFESGKLILSDEKYDLAWLKTAKEALNNADKGKMGLVVTGTLVTADGKIQTEASAGDLADTGAVHAGVTATVTEKDVAIGSGGLENLGVKDLALGGSAADASKVTVGYGKELTLVGSGSENDALVKTSDGTAKNNVAVTVGDSGNAGTLNLGVAGTNSGGNLNAAVAITNDNSKVNVDAGTFKVNEISADKGTISVNEGAALKTDNLTVGSEAGSTVKLSGTGTLEAQSMTVSKGTVEVTGTAKAGNLTVTDNNAKISVGSGDSAGSLVASNASLNGAAVVLDPVWKGNDKIGQASKAALTFTNNSVDGLLTVGRNSVLSLGTDDTGKAEQTFAESELTWGQNGVSAALYIDKAQTLDTSKGGIYVDGTEDKAAAEANKANFADGSLLIVNGSGIGTSGTAALTGGSDSTLTVSQGAKLYLTSTNAGTYTITDGFASTSSITGWDKDKGEVTVNKLSEVESVYSQDGDFTVTVKQKDVQKTYTGIALPNILQAMDQSQTGYAGIKYLTELANDTSLSPSGFIAAVNGFAQGAENSGASHSGTMAAFTIGDTVQGRMSLVNDAVAPQGGKGRRADTGDNGSIWAQYIHNKDKVDNLGGASYDGQYNGVIIGRDFAPTGKYHSGVAFSYGDGSSSGSVSKNEFDFWGLSYYGSIKNDDTNVTFDAGYSRTSNYVKGAVAIESDTKVLTLGVKGEKLINNGHGTSYVPYAGLRYLNVDGGSYNGTIDGKVAAHYSADTANIWMLPLGIGVRNETITASGWKVRPMADIAYVWILGDKNSAMDVTVPGVNAADRLGYDIMDSGFFVGKLGVEAEKGDWTYGLGYAYQKGSSEQSSKWFIDLKYSF